MKIGYSFWGFLGNGIIDTPDGGRIHRLPFIKAIINNGNEIICLQKNRDLLENNEDINIVGLSFSDNFPEIDVLFLEYRWEIPGRNCNISNNDKNYTPDLDRQNELIIYYKSKNIPIIVWDKDQKLLAKPWYADIVYESSWHYNSCKKQLLFSFDDELIKLTLNNLNKYNKLNKTNDLVYIGNQYERDFSFDKYINKAAFFLKIKTDVYGNWNKYDNIYKENLIKYKNVNFKGRIAFKDINSVYSKSFSTVLIAPDRYYNTGQITQRIFESLINFTIPFVPIEYNYVDNIILRDFRVFNGKDVFEKIKYFRSLDNAKIINFLKGQIYMLNLYNSKIQSLVLQKDLVNICKNL